MNIRDIKTKAKSVLVNRSNIIVVFIFISVVTTIIPLKMLFEENK